ncbi:DUF1295 domain-containing protein [Candidatus Palauibacter sp.]|uniref:DUF1295 domain-containing protein n=1 Tax=Candidatus Palauibacter sp. TaxID=3101350 RepID=UPI003B0296D3
MPEATFHGALVWVMFALAVVTFASLLRLKAPYGRHYAGSGWGPDIPDRVGWIVMELPAPAFFAVVYFTGDAAGGTLPLIFLGLWQCHYLNRTFIHPLRTRTTGKRMPAVVAASAFVFNLTNAYVNARWVSELGRYDPGWLGDPRFVAGVLVFAIGFAINNHSDTILIRLRKPAETGYSIPHGGLFRWVSSPNYFGELLEWAGWALATWSLAGLAFFVYTAANLVPRARSHHAWYKSRFEDYPADRKAVIPRLL